MTYRSHAVVVLVAVGLAACFDDDRRPGHDATRSVKCATADASPVELEAPVWTGEDGSADAYRLLVSRGEDDSEAVEAVLFVRPPVLSLDSTVVIGEVLGPGSIVRVNCAGFTLDSVSAPQALLSAHRRTPLSFSPDHQRVSFVDSIGGLGNVRRLVVLSLTDGKVLHEHRVSSPPPESELWNLESGDSSPSPLSLTWRDRSTLVAEVPIAGGFAERSTLRWTGIGSPNVQHDTLGFGRVVPYSDESPQSAIKGLRVDLAALISDANAQIVLRENVRVSERSCDPRVDSLATYSPRLRLIIVCENLNQIVLDLAQQSGGDKNEWLLTIRAFAFFHELGHAVRLDRRAAHVASPSEEESAADEFAAMMLFRSERALTTSLREVEAFWSARARRGAEFRVSSARSHAPDSERARHIQCLLDGLTTRYRRARSGDDADTQCEVLAVDVERQWRQSLRH